MFDFLHSTAGIVVAFISAAGLTAVAFIQGWFGLGKNRAEIKRSENLILHEDLKYMRQEIAAERVEKMEVKAENKVLKEQLLSERADCQLQIDAMKKEIEILRETISQLRTELGLKPLK